MFVFPTIYLAFANHPKAPLEHLREECRQLHQILDPGAKKLHYRLERNEFADLDGITKYLADHKDEIHIFHFSGHAGPGQLKLFDLAADADGMAGLLARQKNTALVFLNGCSTRQQVKRLLDLGIPVVVATATPVDDKRASDFAIRFYQALAGGFTLLESFNQAADWLKAANLSKENLHRGLVLESEEMDDLPWGIYTRDERKLGWKLPDWPAFQLPQGLRDNLHTGQAGLLTSLKQELLKQNVIVTNKPRDIFKYYTWLVETHLQNMQTAAGQERNLSRLSFMTEAYHSALRYLCYIQLARVLQASPVPRHDAISGFFSMAPREHDRFDYLNLLIETTRLLETEGSGSFVQGIPALVDDLADASSDLHKTIQFLDCHRQRLVAQEAPPEGEALEALLDEYLTALVSWLRKLSFLAHYRLVSIKDINLSYRLGTSRKFVHLCGELHGVYDKAVAAAGEDQEDHYGEMERENEFTYNKSVLLLKGTDARTALNNLEISADYLSLSPLIIDKSVFSEQLTQTPTIFYYTGYDAAARKYHYAHFENELPLPGQAQLASNKYLQVREQNNSEPHLNDLFLQLEQLFRTSKNTGR